MMFPLAILLFSLTPVRAGNTSLSEPDYTPDYIGLPPGGLLDIYADNKDSHRKLYWREPAGKGNTVLLLSGHEVHWGMAVAPYEMLEAVRARCAEGWDRTCDVEVEIETAFVTSRRAKSWRKPRAGKLYLKAEAEFAEDGQMGSRDDLVDLMQDVLAGLECPWRGEGYHSSYPKKVFKGTPDVPFALPNRVVPFRKIYFAPRSLSLSVLAPSSNSTSSNSSSSTHYQHRKKNLDHPPAVLGGVEEAVAHVAPVADAQAKVSHADGQVRDHERRERMLREPPGGRVMRGGLEIGEISCDMYPWAEGKGWEEELPE